MKFIFALLIFLTISATAQAGTTINIEQFCRDLTEASNLGYSFEEDCRRREEKAARKMAGRKIPPKIENYCTKLTLGSNLGNSFLLDCIERELAAKERLGY